MIDCGPISDSWILPDKPDRELTASLKRRMLITSAMQNGRHFVPRFKPLQPPSKWYIQRISSDFEEFTWKQVRDLSIKFKTYNVSGSGKLTLEELKMMMEKLGAPQTHLGLKAMIQEVDEDEDGMISFREFMMIFRKAAAGELKEDSGLGVLAKQFEIDVDEVGVEGAKTFFEAKIAAIRKTSKFEDEIREEQEEKRRELEEKNRRQQSFKERAALFGGKGV